MVRGRQAKGTTGGIKSKYEMEEKGGWMDEEGGDREKEGNMEDFKLGRVVPLEMGLSLRAAHSVRQPAALTDTSNQ